MFGKSRSKNPALKSEAQTSAKEELAARTGSSANKTLSTDAKSQEPAVTEAQERDYFTATEQDWLALNRNWSIVESDWAALRYGKESKGRRSRGSGLRSSGLR